jgi:hypothetical protein
MTAVVMRLVFWIDIEIEMMALLVVLLSLGYELLVLE